MVSSFEDVCCLDITSALTAVSAWTTRCFKGMSHIRDIKAPTTSISTSRRNVSENGKTSGPKSI